MLADKLRKSVLQSAIQGKLTEQLATDDKVEDLLQAIEEEKELLIKEKKIKKQKPLPEITEEEIPFEIPKNWRWVRLGALSSVITDGTHKTPNYVNKGIPFISVQNISSGKYKDTKLKYITEDEHKKLICRCKPEKGDILFCRIGTLGHPYIVDLDFEFSIFVSLGLIKLINKDINVYLKAYMDSPSFEWQINKVKVGGGTHTFKLNLKDIVNFLIPLPPLAEQKRIVEKLDNVLANIDELKVNEEKLSILQKNFPDKLKKSILQSAIQGKLTEQLATDDNVEDLLQAIKEEKERLIKEKKIKKQKPLPEITEEEIPFEIPKNWRWVRLGALSSVITDGTHKTPNYVNKGIPFISVQNISSGKYKDTKLKYITEDEHKKLICRCKPEKGDILFCRIGTLGHPYIVDLDFEFSIFVSLGLIKLINKDINVYLKAYMDSPSFEWQINKVKVGGGTHTFKLNLKDIVNFLIPLPPLAEQKRIVEKLDKLLADIEELKI